MSTRYTAWLLSGVVAFTACAAHAQSSPATTYPNRPVRLILPQSPGGPTDIIGRTVAQKLGEVIGQTVVPDNRAGAGGNVGCEIVSKSAPDGYTLLLGAPGCLAVNPSLYEKLPFDPQRDFQFITQLTSGPEMLVVHPSVPANSVKELVALIKAKPGAFNYASGGAGTANHLASEYFKSVAGLQTVHVPFKGTGPAIASVVAGQVQMMMASLPPALPQVKAGKLKGLAVTSLKRSGAAPDVPTVAESGYPGFEMGSWHGILVPAKTPQPIVAKLHADLIKVLSSPDVKERFSNQGLETVGSTPAEFREHVKREATKAAKIIKAAGIKAD